jgi:alpha-tubulin suppressor-like RCC1 family protein
VVTLTEDGVIAWGDDDDLRNVPVGLAATALDSGTNHILALEADGTVVAWGRNNYNQCIIPAGLTAKYIAAGDHHSLALRADGSVVAWGGDYNGLLDIPAGLVAIAITANGYVGVAIGHLAGA